MTLAFVAILLTSATVACADRIIRTADEEGITHACYRREKGQPRIVDDDERCK